ncbi:unnamed protein product [Phaedon cochleariae]|uniref:BTB domain-containing protein n=1 Tax=Phaedon cochleariae TaxID=80249 RepID=A0A9P0GMR2_PHACE|nr:unnamed protein product [Phaedon cochleariae]
MEKDSIFIERLVQPFNKKERLLAFYKSQKFVDCTFRINGMEVKAHKLILACSSPVFEKMLYGDMAQDEIVICDISLQEFNQVLDHIYTENIDIYSVANAWSLFYIANKYMLKDLLHVCLTYVRNNLTMSSLVLSYEYADMFDLLDIKKKCFNDMINYVDGVFFSEYHMKPSTLCDILQTVCLGHDQFSLLANTINWCMVECDLREIPIWPQNIVNILEEENILHFFSKNCCDKVFCSDEITSRTLPLVYELLELPKDPDSSTHHERTPKTCKIRKEFKIACRLDLLHGEEFVSNFKVSRSMILFGVLVNTQIEPPQISRENYKGSVSVRICEHNARRDIVVARRIEDFIPYRSDLYVSFTNPAILEPNVLYDLRISNTNLDIDNGTASLHFYYMSDKLVGENKNDVITFNEDNGSIIKGISFYPA